MALEQRGCIVQPAEDGQEALELIAVAKPDLLILDLAMPRMDGLSCLKELREAFSPQQLPVIVLTAHSDRQMVMDVIRLGVVDYVLKSPFSMSAFLEKVDGALRQTTGCGLSTGASTPLKSRFAGRSPRPPEEPPPTGLAVDRKELERRLKSLTELKGFSPAVTHLLKTIEDPQCTLDQIVESAGLDQALSMRLLWLANSAAFARGVPITSLRKAIVRIGTDQIRETALTLGVFERFGDGESQDLHYGRFWEHSVAVASLAAEIARVSPVTAGFESDAAFTLGLLHDVGRLVLVEALAGSYKAVLDAAVEHGEHLVRTEARLLDTDHARVAKELLAGWKFGARLTRPIGSHHTRFESLGELPGEDRIPVAVLGLANRLSHALVLGDSGDDQLEDLTSWADALALSQDQLDQIIRIVLENWKDTKSIVRLRSQKNWPSAAEGLRERLPLSAHPCCVSGNAQGLLVRRLLMRLVGPIEPDEANLWIVTASAEGVLAEELDGIRALEMSKTGKAPVLILGDGKEPETALLDRPWSLLGPPIRVGGVIDSLARLAEPGHRAGEMDRYQGAQGRIHPHRAEPVAVIDDFG